MTFIFKSSKKDASLSEVFALFNWSSLGYISAICSANPGLSMVNISSRYQIYDHPLLTYLKKLTTYSNVEIELDRTFISHLFIPWGKIFSVGTVNFALFTLTLTFDLLWKTLILAITFQPNEVRLPYYKCIYCFENILLLVPKILTPWPWLLTFLWEKT